MKKNKHHSKPPPATTTTSTTLISEITASIHDHALFFDKLIELIPAKFYLSNDDDSKPWFQGLNKAAKASAKKQTRENIKKARRDRHDPEKSQTSTLDLLKQSFETTEENPNDDTELVDGKPIEDLDGEGDKNNKPATYEDLKQRFQRKLEELKGNRGQGKRSMYDGRRDNQNQSNKRQKKSAEFGEKSARADVGNLVKGKSDGDIQKEVLEATKSIEFGRVKLGGDADDGLRKKGKSKAKEFEQAKRLQELKSDPNIGDKVAKKHSWKAAVSRAAGVKVHDNPNKLKQSLHKDKKRHEKNVGKWKDRVDTTEKLKKEKQQKRAGNIAERAADKKKRKIAKREKKLMRPGFEGRKEGYINGK